MGKSQMMMMIIIIIINNNKPIKVTYIFNSQKEPLLTFWVYLLDFCIDSLMHVFNCPSITFSKVWFPEHQPHDSLSLEDGSPKHLLLEVHDGH